MKKKIEIDENYRTPHGDNIANKIQGADAFGDFDNLTIADIWNILDNLHTHFLDTKRDNKFLSKWMDELEKKYPDIETY